MIAFEFRPSKKGLLASLSYPLLFLFLYFTLAAHLRLVLGRWPLQISDNPTTLAFHIHEVAAGVLFGFGMLLAPLGAGLAVILAFVPRTRRAAGCLALFVVGCVFAFAVMHLVPSSFMMWWLD